jgi:hypothetical protein
MDFDFRKNKTPRPRPEAAKPATNVTININFPKLRAPKIQLPKSRPELPKLPYKLIAKRLGGVAVILLCAFIIHGVINHVEGKGKKVAAAPSGPRATAPGFTPVVPKSKPQLASAVNNTLAAYDDQRKVYSFQDTLLGTSLIVSEQALPAKFSSGGQAVSQIAGSMGAKTPIDTAAGPAYLKTEASNGEQTINVLKAWDFAG